MHDAGNPWCIVGAVRFKFPAAQGLLKGHLVVHALIDGIRLVTVGDNGLVSQHPHRSIDDQAGIRQLCRIKGLGADAVAILHKYAVAAVLASSMIK